MPFTRKWKTSSRSPTYRSWAAMRQRCRAGSATARGYAARGIKVCPQWQDDFDQFVADMGMRPAGMTLDRIDINGHYSPDNCRWATDAQQRANKRNTRLFTHAGKTQQLHEWANELGVPVRTLQSRFYIAGRSVAEVLSAEGHKRKAVLKHGTLNGYNYHKCRCDECRKANTQDKIARKAKTTRNSP